MIAQSRPSAAASASAPVPPAAPARPALGIFTLALGFVLASLDVTIINIAGPSLRTGLGLSLSGLTWVVSGYVLAFAALLLLAGSLAGRYGARRTYLAGLALFTAASLLAAAAPGAGVLIAGRILQGAGAALFMPSSLTLLLAAFPGARERARVLGLWSAIVSVAAGLGPAVGGLLVGTFGWRSVFLINLPLGLLGLVLAHRVIAPLPGRPAPLAAAGHALGLLALAALSYGLIEGPDLGWAAPRVLVPLAVAVLAGAAFVVRERRAAVRVLPRALFSDARFPAANAIGFLFNFGLFGGLFMLGLFLQNARGASPVQAGLQMLPVQAVWLLGNVLYARTGPRTGNRVILTVTLAVAAAGTLVLALTVSPGMPYWVLATVLATLNVGIGMASPAMTGATMESAGTEHSGIAGAALNANRQIGSLVGVGAVSAVLTAADGWYAGAAASFGLTAGAYAAAGLVAWLGLRAGSRTPRSLPA
ncbi:MFS transporter [Streptomyces telluris]|uniref:MFS transporter n=1 Tax=Streptomyces telluris TaxID=2720021 RepID=A0A9X2LD13_9ACTN|nr:MFS transporter [Streptomyces telluris]MCQ8768759.1 MFS transporter [Streptomyces telluris]NJP77243.1 MFS transporter [Streptomyces telluris]